MGGILVSWKSHQHRAVPLKDKVIIVTGASSGIGWETAQRFAEAGAHLILAARREGRLEDLQQRIQAQGGSARVIVTDVGREEDLQNLVTRTLAAFGRIDVLVNDAGVAYGGPYPELAHSELEEQLRVNLHAPMRLTHLVLPIMLQQGTGHIVNVSSVAARTAWPGIAAYVATRAGLAGFTHALRRELLGTGIHTTVIMPVWTRTGMISARFIKRLRGYGFTISAAEKPAAAIVAAVRYRRPIVALGGPVERIGAFIDARAPQVLDLIWRILMPPDFMDIMRALK